MELPLAIVLLCFGSVVYGQLFICPRDEFDQCVDGLYSDPRECESYYNCTSCTATSLSCPQGEHFNPHLKACMAPGDARCDGLFVTGSLFCVTREAQADGPMDIVPYPVVISNSVNPFDRLSNTVLTPAFGTYFFHMSAGFRPGESCHYRLNGLPSITPTVYSNNPAHAVDVQTRDVMSTVTQSTTLSLSIEAGTSTFSDSSRATMWSGFRLEEFMSETIAFSAEKYSNVSAGNTIVFDSVVVSSGNSYDETTGLFTAPVDGTYLFSFTGGVASDGRLGCYFTSSINGFTSIVLRSPRSANYSFIDTISKSILVEMTAGESMSMYVDTGNAVTTGEVSLSFSGFLYSLAGAAEAWAVYRTSFSDPVDPLDFNIISINDNSMYNTATDRVEITTTGYYYITVTGGTSVNQPLDMPLFVTDTEGYDSQLISIYRSDDIGAYVDTDTIGRTVIALLNAGETLRVSVRGPGQLFSSTDKLVSFCGFLLYPAASL